MSFAPQVTLSDVQRVVRHDFPAELADRVTSLLETYGPGKWHVEKNRVHLACLKIANGDLQSLQRQISIALVDFRDVIAVAEYPGVFRIGFIGMEKLQKTDPSSLEDLQRRDWEQYRSWLNESRGA